MAKHKAHQGDEPIIPRYGRGCVTDVVPALLSPPDAPPAWLPEPAVDAERLVLLMLDGLGWEQLDARRKIAPTLASMTGGPITTVAPSTTATALTSVVTGSPPGEHGIIGYRINVAGEVLNILRWSTSTGDARDRIRPARLQTLEPFGGQRPPVVTRTEFAGSGFTQAHLAGTRLCGYRIPSALVVEVAALVNGGEPFVYAYYDGVDKASHAYGLGVHYDAELVAADRLVADLLGALPSRTTLVVIADHGQVEVGDNVVSIDRAVLDHVSLQSGEGRFRWLHARQGHHDDLLAAADACHGDQAWVRSREQIEAEQWLGPKVSDAARRRLGDVAVVAREDLAFEEATDTGLYDLVGRHGSLTPAEMFVPLIAMTTD